MCERKKKEEKERMIREIGEARTERKVWELIGRVRKRRKRINEEIKPEEWKEYFMEFMGGVENRVVKGKGGGGRQEEEGIELEEGLIADIDDYMKKDGWGGMRLRGEKVYTLMYADDIALLAEEEQDMRSMISRLEGYLDGKGLTLSIEKTKIMRFRKEGGRKKKYDWRWKGRKLEEVNEFKYLGYTLKKNEGQEAHIREKRKKAARTVMGYGAEIWEWKERREVEGIHERYLRWVLGVNWRTPGYMVRDELEREKMRARASKRAWKFERKLEEGRGGEIARKCLEEMKERWKRGKIIGRWEQERKGYLEGIGVEVEEEEEVLERKEKWKEKQERMEKIRESNYNKCTTLEEIDIFSSNLEPQPSTSNVQIESNHQEQMEIDVINSQEQSLSSGKIPPLSKSNDYKYPDHPPNLLPLDPITERLISPRLPFMQIRRLRYETGTYKIIGQVINVLVEVDNMVKHNVVMLSAAA
ncbi:trichohyalin-like [Temnothorax curvispinosus]|uniref:Trichohyalin-like n=1 Tax=Temnothorax curvispinosus TaxID=300111 RepID=A0A6J1QMF8_9HYME|nr:trichohyalin-like [Temnothorax curvispinosus]